MRYAVRSAIGAIMCALTATSCASLNINAIPAPGTSYQGGYNIVAEFANVLNLPDKAKVVLDGTTVGVVTKVSIASSQVDVTARIDRDVVVPSNIHALLQQATVLGDIYIALERGQDTRSAGPPLGPGGRIPLAQTTSPPQLEDTIAHLANFIGSGSIQRAQNTVIGINRVTPPKDELRRVVSQVTTDLKDLSNNIDNVDLLINSLYETSTVLATRTPALTLLLSPAGVAGFRRDVILGNIFGTLLPSLGSIYNGGYWLTPLIDSLGNALKAVQGSKQAVEAEYPAYRKFITDYFLPQDKYPAINITSIIGPDGRELSGNVEQVLRMLGAVP
ncbi:ABC-type transporter Mla maintaining outer membrane lipid asymmetry, periplasmic component MlaD [Mycobacterium numidiamassiliense]|uniref:ABC-type transporter Mla maintaining outer membrane lipid asymmetry, periplasmic component MlaD n=1 Tax=Mycobacterium numidiamassiliense TaxID=1841861 RepID=A0A2U3P929_9MYCO|nr:MlaD family protein [Mycobacterium numidiamassiliense]SPM40273.1 ABC-type transporter Mla maintaining outer membrane lipid asymmetry, periplasmic component MlaD [Mycobacterium numidiamassiliense]